MTTQMILPNEIRNTILDISAITSSQIGSSAEQAFALLEKEIIDLEHSLQRRPRGFRVSEEDFYLLIVIVPEAFIHGRKIVLWGMPVEASPEVAAGELHMILED